MPYREPAQVFTIDEVLEKRMTRALRIASRAYENARINAGLYDGRHIKTISVSNLAIKIFDKLPNDEE